MLKRPLPITPTFTISFEQSISAPPSRFDHSTSFTTCCSQYITRTLLLDDDYAALPRKRHRGIAMMHSPSVSLQEQHRESNGSPQSFHSPSTSPALSLSNITPAASPLQQPIALNSLVADQQSYNDKVVAEKDIAGPSRLGFAFRREGPVNLNTSPLSRQRRRKVPPKLLSPPRSMKDTLAGTRSMPSSPMFPSKFGKATNEVEAEREQLRESLRGAPRRRPSVPFGMRTTALPALAIPAKGARLNTEAPPPIWQDPSEHILSGNGSSLQHARSVYASGPVEVLPGLFLGDEFNARDDARLAQLGITTILNVAKETTLPFQSDAASRQLDLLASASLSRGMQNISIGEPVATSTSWPEPPKTSAREAFFTPMTSMNPTSSTMSTMQSSREPSSSFYLRNTTSTPNLLSPFATASSGQGDVDVTDSDTMSSHRSAGSTPPSPASHLPAMDNLPKDSPAELFTSSTSSNQKTATSTSSAFSIPSITLPHNAVALNVLPSPQTGRTQGLRYIKLPWTHDETELAGSGAGGFITGCSIIADALGIDFTTGQTTRASNVKEGILVHCQCGVSRSATLVIAFVMQAAAYNYHFQETQRLTGMHDCYELVKELSSSISPNCSLIYQLVEWERYLSKQVAASAATEIQAMGHPSALSPDKKWGNEAMNEEDWTRMRMDEERKEREEEDKSREVRLQEAKAAALRKSSISQSPPSGGVGATGIGARRKRPTPSLKLASSARATADHAVSEQDKSQAAPLSKLDEGAPQSLALKSLQGARPSLRALTMSPPLQTTSSNTSATSTLLAGSSPKPSGTFGQLGQSAAERRSKHKRTFSSELPAWNRPSSITAMAPVEDEDSVME